MTTQNRLTPQDSNRAAYIMPLSGMNETDRRLIRAYLRCGSATFEEAAALCGVSPRTVSRAWRRWRIAIDASVEWPG